MRSFWAIALLAFAGVAQAAGLSGTWSGTWTKNGDALPVIVTFRAAGDGLAGSFDSDALQVAGIPFREISETGGKVHFTLPGDETTAVFDATLTANALDGSFIDGTAKGTFHLKRAAAAQPVAARDVTFESQGARIAGTVLLPASSGRHPAVVFLHGSGPEGRWANRWLAQRFAQSGFVALISDKRGVGQSTGNWKDVGFDALADDAVAAIAFLARQPEVDAKHIGLYGHSQGGTIAPYAACISGQAAFVIVSAPGGVEPEEIEEFSVSNAISIPKLPRREADDARSFVHALVDVAFRDKPRAELDKLSDRFKGRSWYFEPPPDDYYWAFSRRIADYIPATYWRRIDTPVLILFGGRDERVPARSYETIIAALHSGGNMRVKLKLYPDADHTFAVPGKSRGWPKRVPDYADAVIGWAKKQVPPTSP